MTDFNEKILRESIAIDCDVRTYVDECTALLSKYFNDNDVSSIDGLSVAALLAIAMWKYQGQPVEPLLATILANWDAMTVWRKAAAEA